MGSSSSKENEKNEVAYNATQMNEDGGFHVVEFHLPSASYGITFLILLAALLLAFWVLYQRCILRPRKKREQFAMAPPIYWRRPNVWDNERFHEVRIEPRVADKQPRHLPANV